MKVTVERLGRRGEGVVQGPLFVPLSLPGETVEGHPVEGRLHDVRVLEPAAERVRPPCPNFKGCGGCALQHGSDRFVAEWKKDLVLGALAARGIAAEVAAMHVSPPASRRRATLHGRRTKRGALVGFFARGSDQIIAIPSCRLLRPALMGAISALERLTVMGASRKATLAFALTETEAGLDLAVRGGKPLDRNLAAEAAALATEYPIARLSWDGEPVAMAQEPFIELGSARIAIPPGAFLQATKEGEAALQQAVLRALKGTRKTLDLFAGIGTFSLPLAQQAEVVAVEGDTAMLDALDRGWRGAGGRLKKLRTEVRDLFRRPFLSDELGTFDGVVIDPPRAGAEAQSRELAAHGPAVIAAVSCDPVSFARDAEILLAGGYTIDWLEVVDQFRWSPHIELAARFSRR